MDKKYQGFGFANYMSTPKPTTSTSNLAVKLVFVKATYTEKIKIFPNILVTKDKMYVPPRR